MESRQKSSFAVEDNSDCPECKSRGAVVQYEWPANFGRTLKCLRCPYMKDIDYQKREAQK